MKTEMLPLYKPKEENVSHETFRGCYLVKSQWCNHPISFSKDND